jgi:hypothetical protein
MNEWSKFFFIASFFTVWRQGSKPILQLNDALIVLVNFFAKRLALWFLVFVEPRPTGSALSWRFDDPKASESHAVTSTSEDQSTS